MNSAVATSQYSHKKMDYYDDESGNHMSSSSSSSLSAANWKRVILLIVAITVHNIPGEILAGSILLSVHKEA